MKILMYGRNPSDTCAHHEMPFGRLGKAPSAIFDKEKMAAYCSVNAEAKVFCEEPVWSLLEGLNMVELAGAIAHVSLPVSEEKQAFGEGFFLSLMITNMPEGIDEHQLPEALTPEIAENLSVLCSAEYRNNEKPFPKNQSADQWKEFFLHGLSENKAEHEKKLEKLKNDVEKTKHLISFYAGM